MFYTLIFILFLLIKSIGKTRDGRGVQIWNNHSIYEGIWENNHLRKGRLIFSNGDSYCGYFINDKAHGKGKLVKKSGGFYDGDWFEEKKHGYGKILYLILSLINIFI